MERQALRVFNSVHLREKYYPIKYEKSIGELTLGFISDLSMTHRIRFQLACDCNCMQTNVQLSYICIRTQVTLNAAVFI